MSQLQKNEAIRKILEFSKVLVKVDIIVYCVFMVAVLAIVVLRPDLAEYCVSIIGYTTTAYIALRGAYSAKAAIENVKKIQTGNKVSDEETENG